MQDQRAELEWREGRIPVSTRFDDPYFSLDNGLAETAYVFLDGNGLPGRFRDGFHIAELGFGSGLNLLAAVRLWRDSGQQGTLRYTTFEAFPMSAEQMVRAQSAFAEIAGIAAEFAPHWPTARLSLPGLEFRMIKGDARDTLPRWDGTADAWFLDGFSPAKNPQLWEPGLMAQVGVHTAATGTAATYTAAGFVRRGLEEAGFEVARRPGYGRKRHMTIARKAR
ncbi:tRNA (5-methylaminomethyl-2-thiouridine)(34)-methyltransferase MnmD [Thalassovita sp.]|uniref:tRNA (5-methylaminomethyl-2-thiouridine)(34)-methyltransferase MnmD n=1 Tax=Thalassovita sp. TaxID=1979401 RepID=UPI0029DE64B0|nr:tRNA (5-methylaminomethyl-2-thiouridine)(34)-methyltransferase MnmD [Thalassovita sp.]